MDGATLNGKVWAGYARAATKIGTPYQHYRPTSSSNPISAGNLLGTMPVSLNADDPKFSRPNLYGKATWYAVADGSQLRVGDYIVGIEGTLFVAALQQILPILAVDTQGRTISILRPQQQSGVGALGYGGDTDANETPLMTNWPASILQAGKGEKSEVGLPGDVKTPQWQILLPYWPGVTLQTSDIVTDDIGKRYAINSAELTELGWRILAAQVQT